MITKTATQPLTPQQRAAIEARSHSVSLAAGAGCGKTFVLTERFIAELDPTAPGSAADLDQLVAITFTDAAAREMRDRIRGACYDRLKDAASDDEAAAWQRLIRSMDAARISTIHAFCTTLLRQHAVAGGLDPQFEVLDAPAAELLRLEVIDDRLRTLLVERNDDVLDYAARRGLERLREDLANFCGPRHAAAIEGWRDKTPQQLVARWIEFFEREAAPLAAGELLAAPALAELRRLADSELAATPKLREHLAALAAVLCDADGLASNASGALESLDRLRELARVQGVCREKDWHDPADYGRFRDAAKAVRDLIDGSVLKRPLELEAASEAAALGLALVRVAADVSKALAEAKTRRQQLEFDDLLIRAHGLLADPANESLRQQVVRRARLMMVDEFQDTNHLQASIIKAFCGPEWTQRGLFAVGDFKQSIYAFNGAEPGVSAELRAALPPAGRLSLTTNFRSQPAVLDFVNAVFHDAFDGYERLVAQRPQTTPTPAVEFLWTPGARAASEEESGEAKTDAAPKPRRRAGAARDARAEEARWIARRLRQLLDAQTPIVGDETGDADGEPTLRPLELGDVAILLRSLSDAQVYEEALREAGLDYYLAGGHAFYSQQEIFDMLNLLRAVASAVDEIALAGALRSPLFALTDEALFWMVDRHGSLNAALAAAAPPPQLAADEASKVRRAAETLSRLRSEKDRLLVAELLALALDLTGYDATLLAEFLGPRKVANLEKLVEQARALDRGAPGDLPAFITQLSEFVAQAPKEALAATQAEGGDVIRIMTIHYAKGLEFPLVVLPDLERPRHTGGGGPVLDERLGPLVPLADRKGAVGFDLHRFRENLADLEERKRLLYVATTRAADYLILSSSIDDVDRPSCDWLQLVDGRISLADGALRAPLPADYGTPNVRVITEQPEVARADDGQPHGADLHRLIVKTREAAAANRKARRSDGIPREALGISPDASARRRFSFSQITGLLTPVDRAARPSGGAEEFGDEPSDDEVPFVDVHDRADVATQRPGGVGGREFGTLVHAILERIDLRQPRDIRAISEFLAIQLIGSDPASSAAAAAALVERFLQTPLAAELAAAPVVRREVEFLLPWPPGAVSSQGPYLHGYIDCLYQDAAGRWRLIDYKTNHIAANQVSQSASAYELQMLAYRLACEQALGEPLAESSLVLLHPQIVKPLAWDAAAERRGIDRITAAITSIASQ